MIRIGRDPAVMGEYRNGRIAQGLAYTAAAVVVGSLCALAAAVGTLIRRARFFLPSRSTGTTCSGDVHGYRPSS